MASLIAERRVSCVDLVSFFIEQTKRVDPHLAIVTVTLYDEAMSTAASLDREIEQTGKTRGPLTCIPFGVKVNRFNSFHLSVSVSLSLSLSIYIYIYICPQI